MEQGEEEDRGWRGGHFDGRLWQYLVSPHVIKTQGSGFSDEENIQLGAAKALGKVAINK